MKLDFGRSQFCSHFNMNSNYKKRTAHFLLQIHVKTRTNEHIQVYSVTMKRTKMLCLTTTTTDERNVRDANMARMHVTIKQSEKQQQ